MKPVKLSVIRSERAAGEAKELRRDLYRRLGSALRQAGPDVAGYAVVLWEKNGANYSIVRPGSPVLSRMVPAFVGDSLTQHVTIDLVEDR